MSDSTQGHLSIARMNEAIDGALSSFEMEAVERHVETCALCRDEYARLSEVVGALRTLPRQASAPDAAWSAIAARIEAPGLERDGADETPVLEFDAGRRDEGDSRTRRIRSGIYMSLGQLAAAAALVAIVSATIVWMGMNGGSAVPANVTVDASPSGGAAARAVSLEAGRYSEAVDALQSILDEGRAVLDPETLFTIEESLRTVDEAIADVEQALAKDPNSALLLRLLANQQRTKLGVLQRAADAVHAQT